MKRRDDGIDVQGKAPSFQFYPADYERDVATLGLDEQAIWMRMLCKMHWAKRRGYLEHPSGAQISSEDLARLVGQPVKVVQEALDTMERIGVFSREQSGVIFCRRMVRDTAISDKRKQAGKLGGNPDLMRQARLFRHQNGPFEEGLDNLEVKQNGLVKQEVKQNTPNERLVNQVSEFCLDECTRQNPTPSYSSSSSFSPSGPPSLSEHPLTTPQPERTPPGTLEEKIAWIQESLHNYVSQKWSPPDQEICLKFLEATNGASLGLIGNWLKQMQPKEQPEKNYAWFVTMARKVFQPPKLEKAGKSIPAIP
jgi:hypothetical protein